MSKRTTVRIPAIPEPFRSAALAAVAAALWCAPLAAQDQPPPGESDESAEQAEPEGAPAESGAEGAGQDAADGASDTESADDTAAEDSELDDQTYEGDDDVFVPSEEIPVDEPIPFPSDI